MINKVEMTKECDCSPIAVKVEKDIKLGCDLIEYDTNREWGLAKVKLEYDPTIDYGGIDPTVRKSEFPGFKAENVINCDQNVTESKAEHGVIVKYSYFTEMETDDGTIAEESDSNKSCSNACIKVGSVGLVGIESKNNGGIFTSSTEYPVRPKKKNKPVDHTRILKVEKRFSCTLCNYSCNEAANLKVHMRIHTGEKPFSCDLCDYKCGQISHFKRHMMTHTGEKPFSCGSCDFRCITGNDLKIHMRSHSGEKPFSCDFCDYKCSQAGNLKEHVLIHTGEKPFVCDCCDYRCGRASQLRVHLRIHTGEKPFSCDYCDYRFSRSDKLKDHMRTHTGEKPLSCGFCDYRCNRSDKLKRHVRVHSGEKLVHISNACSSTGLLKRHARLYTHKTVFDEKRMLIIKSSVPWREP